jgi:hypothetical protein
MGWGELSLSWESLIFPAGWLGFASSIRHPTFYVRVLGDAMQQAQMQRAQMQRAQMQKAEMQHAQMQKAQWPQTQWTCGWSELRPLQTNACHEVELAFFFPLENG